MKRASYVPSSRLLLVTLGTFGAFALTGCNEQGDPLSRSQDPDPSPSATASPSPSPSASPSPSPSPSPTATSGALYTGPAEVEKYVVKFVDDAKAQGKNVLHDMKSPMLQIRIASLDAYGGSVIGLCETSGSLRRVTFDPDFWNSVSDTQKEILSHHELGHCVLYRGHKTQILSSGAYASVMYPTIMSSATYNGNYNYYQQELFSTYALEASDSGIPISSSKLAPTDPEAVTTHICDESDIPKAE